MNKKSLFSLTTIALLLFSSISFSQETLNLGILTSFEGYTGAGAVTNSGGTVTGDVGTHLGIISGLELPDYTGNKYNSDADTDQARKDLLRLYIHLNDKFVDFPGTHAAAFANETLSPGVYSIDGAGSIGGALILDGGPNDFFIFKMNGALTVGAAATVTLTGGVQSCNVFWLVNGAISVAADAEVKGTLFSKTGAVGLGAGTLLEGRMLTMGGAITLGVGAEATRPSCTSTIPIFCEADCSSALDILGVLSDFTLFASAGNVANTGISGINGKIGTNAGTITGFGLGIHIQDEEIANTLTQQAADDLDAAYDALMLLTATGTHPAAYLNETITPGVYDITGAGSLGGTVTLDALGDPDAIFVFRFSGAFNIAALSKMILANGARRCNIFWLGGAGVVTGAVNIGASAQIKGNFISHGGACNSGGGVFMSGRQLATFGAVNTNTAVIYANPECVNSTPLGAAIALVKTASVGGMVGDVITYTFTVTNTGTSTLNNIEVTDPMVGLAISGSPISSLAVGTSSDITATYTITQADGDEGTVTNSAMVTSDEGVTDVSGTTIDNDTPTVTTIVQTPAVALVKTATLSGSGILGDVITYTFRVTNTGTSTLNNIVVTDPMIITSFIGSPILSLAVGASSDITATYTITQADIDTGSVTNSATVTSDEGATDVSGTTIDNNTSTITTIPAVALVKTATLSGSGILGDVITYTFRVTNTGTSTLNNIVVTDPMAGLSSLTGSPILSLAVGASSDITATYTITQSDIDTGSVTNSALVTAQDPDGNDITDVSGTTIDNNTSTITTIPAVALVKTAIVSGTGTLGDVITYTFRVTNTGTSTLNNIVVTDPMVGLSSLTGSPILSLAVGASSDITATYTITQSDIDTGSVTNSALVTAQDPDGNDITDVSGTEIDNDTSTITTITQTPAIALVKTAIVSGTGALGDVITYIFTVENTGNTTLTNVVVTDPMLGLVITGSPILSLAVGVSSVITGTYTIIQSDIDTGNVTNTATATSDEGATDISGTANDNDDSTITTITQTPAIALVKTAIVSGTGILGDVITYTFAVTNTGNTTLTNILVTDPMVGLSPLTGSPISSLAVGASSSVIIGTYTITQSDIDTGSVTNSATATSDEGATDVSGTEIDNDTSTITTITKTPAIALVKTAIVSGTGTLGDVITYIFRVENTGNTTLTNIVVTDPMVGLAISGSPISSLAVGVSSVITGTYTIIQSDIDTGNVTNTATATSDEGATDISGTANDNDTPTVTPIITLPDFTPTIDIEGLVFPEAGDKKDFVINISEINGEPSDGQVVVKIIKGDAFLITAKSNITIGGNTVTTNNGDWTIVQGLEFITITLETSIIVANSFSSIGFEIERKPNVPAQTTQPITVTIENGSGGDSYNNNNTYNTVVQAQ